MEFWVQKWKFCSKKMHIADVRAVFNAFSILFPIDFHGKLVEAEEQSQKFGMSHIFSTFGRALPYVDPPEFCTQKMEILSSENGILGAKMEILL